MKNNSSGSREHQLDEDDFLISRTDLSGKITYANPAFIEASGFSWQELDGADHNVISHPDMPKTAFENLAATLRQGRAWNGLVLNSRKNGDYYWVQAHVTPYFERGELVGFASVRTKADEKAIRLAREAYREFSSGRSRKYRMVDGELRRTGLHGLLESSNFSSISCRISTTATLSVLMLLCSYFLGTTSTDADSPYAALAGYSPIALFIFSSIIFLIGHRTTQSIKRPIDEAMKFCSQIAAGNLRAQIRDFGDTEVGRLAKLMDVMRKSLSSITTDVNKSIQFISSASSSIAAGNEALAARTEDQAASLQETAASMEEITSTVEQNSSNARSANQLTDDAFASVRGSGETMGKVVQKMKTISDASQRMGEIIELIDAIAFQSNTLSLNASIEAARAGEHGRGFAVVATEVRHLAGRSAAAARDIRTLIDDSALEVAEGVTLVKAAEASIGEVIGSVTQVSDIMAEISAASAEQSAGIAQIGQAIAQLDNVTQKNSGMVQHASRASRILQEQVSELIQTISIFHSDQRGASRNSTRPHGSGTGSTGNHEFWFGRQSDSHAEHSARTATLPRKAGEEQWASF